MVLLENTVAQTSKQRQLPLFFVEAGTMGHNPSVVVSLELKLEPIQTPERFVYHLISVQSVHSGLLYSCFRFILFFSSAAPLLRSKFKFFPRSSPVPHKNATRCTLRTAGRIRGERDESDLASCAKRDALKAKRGFHRGFPRKRRIIPLVLQRLVLRAISLVLRPGSIPAGSKTTAENGQEGCTFGKVILRTRRH